MLWCQARVCAIRTNDKNNQSANVVILIVSMMYFAQWQQTTIDSPDVNDWVHVIFSFSPLGWHCTPPPAVRPLCLCQTIQSASHSKQVTQRPYRKPPMKRMLLCHTLSTILLAFSIHCLPHFGQDFKTKTPHAALVKLSQATQNWFLVGSCTDAVLLTMSKLESWYQIYRRKLLKSR